MHFDTCLSFPWAYDIHHICIRIYSTQLCGLLQTLSKCPVWISAKFISDFSRIHQNSHVQVTWHNGENVSINQLDFWVLLLSLVRLASCCPWSTSTWPSQPPCHLFLTASIPWIYCIHSKIQQAVGKWIKCRNQLRTYVFNAALMHEVQIFVKLEKNSIARQIILKKKYNIMNPNGHWDPSSLHRLKLPGANEIWNMPKDSVSETSWAPLHVRCLHNVQPSSGILCKHDRWFGIYPDSQDGLWFCYLWTRTAKHATSPKPSSWGHACPLDRKSQFIEMKTIPCTDE